MEKPEQRKVTSVNPIVGVLDFFSDCAKILQTGTQPSRDDVFTDKFDSIIVDTCCTSDTGVWETGIRRDNIEGEWIIVTQYESREEAEIGHQNWVAYMKENPTCELKDVDMWNLGLNNASN